MTHQSSTEIAVPEPSTDPAAKRREILMFVVLAFVIWPFVAIAVVGGYGFVVWMYQTIAGPPGPPPV
jgi:periplasmic nitrate reductase NapE